MSDQPQHPTPQPGAEAPHGGQPPDGPGPSAPGGPGGQGPSGPGGPYAGRPYPPPPPGGGYLQPMSPADQRTWGMVAHLAPFVGYFVGLPFIGALVVYLVYRDRGDFVRRHSAESLNFQLTLLIAYAICTVLSFTIILLPITVPALIVLGIGSIVLQIMAAVAANNGRDYRYPLTIRFVS